MVQSAAQEIERAERSAAIHLRKELELDALGFPATRILTHQQISFFSNKAQIDNLFTLRVQQGFPKGQFALEFNINLLAGDAHDRYIRFGSEQHRLQWQGVISQQREVQLVDEYFRVALQLTTNIAIDWWVYPIFSVSQSEEGFERVYQGSSLLAVFAAREAIEPKNLRIILQATAI